MDGNRVENRVESKKNSGYLIGLFTGMIVMLAVYIAVVMFFPDVLSGSSESASGRFAAGHEVTRGAEPVYPTIGAKVDEIVSLLYNNFVEEIDLDEFAEKIFREIVSLLNDPYTNYLSPAQFSDFLQDTSGIYTGIGVQVTGDVETNHVRVITPFEGAPGEAAGLLPGDFIVKVNGYEVFGDRLTEAVSMILGDRGTSVDLTVYRPYTGETLEFTIIRDIITIPTVNHRMLENNVGYLRIMQFNELATAHFTAAIEELTASGMEGLILDLRNNPGGLLPEVVRITDMLVPEGLIVYTEDRHGNRSNTRSSRNFLDIPLLVLVNGASASASEILAGAVRDHGVGYLVGETTFGKGLVQKIYTLPDGSAVKMTVSRYFTPGGTVIQGVGLTPDHEIEMDIELTVRLSQLTLDEDVQLRYAIDLMNDKLGN